MPMVHDLEFHAASTYIAEPYVEVILGNRSPQTMIVLEPIGLPKVKNTPLTRDHNV